MTIPEFIEQQKQNIKDDFSLEQVKKDVWNHIHRKFVDVATLEFMITMSMDVYAEIVKP